MARTKSTVAAAATLSLAAALTACGSTGSKTTSPGTTGGATQSASPVAGGGGAKFTTAACTAAGAASPNFSNGIPTISGQAGSVSGAGSTFAAPMYSVWTKAYSQTAGGIQVPYQSIGSGGGVQQIIAGTVDFGDSDVPMKDSELAQAKGGAILHVPLLVGGVVAAYHLKGIGSGLKFTGDVLGKIYAGNIKTWNDPALAAINPGVKLPNEPIAVVHRSDGSGTTGIWTKYLTKTSPTWVSKLGGSTKSEGKTVAWPVGIGGKGNEGVSGQVNQTEGGLGYVELQYAIAQHETFGQVQNADGSAYVQPCIATDTAAADKATFPPDLRGDLTNEPGTDSYPIAGTTYALIYEKQTDKAKAAALVNFFSWVLTKGQDLNASINYSPLGAALQQKSIDQLKKVTVNGQPLAG